LAVLTRADTANKQAVPHKQTVQGFAFLLAFFFAFAGCPA